MSCRASSRAFIEPLWFTVVEMKREMAEGCLLDSADTRMCFVLCQGAAGSPGGIVFDIHELQAALTQRRQSEDVS